MIKIIAVVLLAAGSSLIITGVFIFILSDLRAVLNDLSTTKKLETDSGIDDAVQEAYYSESYAPDVTEEKPRVKGFIRRKSDKSSETSMLSSSDKKRDEMPQGKRRDQAEDTQPLETLREILSETAPLTASGKAGMQPSYQNASGTQPLYQEKIPEEKEGSEQEISGTEPLHRQPISETQPLCGGQPLSETQPLYSGNPVSETQPLYQQQCGSETQSLGKAQEEDPVQAGRKSQTQPLKGFSRK